MKVVHRVLGSIALVGLGVACGGSPGASEDTGATAAAAEYVPSMGFTAFGGNGGYTGLCLAIAGNQVVATDTLESVSCYRGVATLQQYWAWVPIDSEWGGMGQIEATGTLFEGRSPLCVDITSGTPLLQACNAQVPGQIFVVSGGEIANLYENECLTVANGSMTSGTPIEAQPCSGSPAQNFMMWGVPSSFDAPPWGCIGNPAWGSPLNDDEGCSTPASTFTILETGQVIQDNPSFGGECLTVTGMNGTQGTATLQPCLSPQDPTQTWHEQVVISSAYTATGTTSNLQLVSAVMGRVSALKRASECLQGDGTVGACADTPIQLFYQEP